MTLTAALKIKTCKICKREKDAITFRTHSNVCKECYTGPKKIRIEIEKNNENYKRLTDAIWIALKSGSRAALECAIKDVGKFYKKRGEV